MADTRGKFFQVLQHIGFETVNQDFAMQAIEFGKFENMKKMEAEDQFNSKILRPGDPSDPDSYKVRKGEVGGYVDYFTDDEITLLHDSIAGLDPYYGYTESS